MVVQFASIKRQNVEGVAEEDTAEEVVALAAAEAVEATGAVEVAIVEATDREDMVEAAIVMVSRCVRQSVLLALTNRRRRGLWWRPWRWWLFRRPRRRYYHPLKVLIKVTNTS